MDFNELKNMMDSQQKISDMELSKVPKSSGAYIGWQEGNSQCFYVGKSKKLRKRIKSHYSESIGIYICQR